MSSVRSRVYLHIGLPKTGTTSLQGIMWHNRDLAASQGVLYPGVGQDAHYGAVVDLHPGRYTEWREPGMAGAWDCLIEQVRAWPRNTLISSELLAPASPEETQLALSSLDFAEVHIVCTVRDLARQIPSVWQENVKTRKSASLTEFLADLRSGELNLMSRLFWDFQDAPRVLRTWGRNLPPENVHVVTVPRRGAPAGTLWERFASVIGLDPSLLSMDVPRHNFSLGGVEAELLRRINLAVGEDLDWPTYAATVKDYFATQVLTGLSDPAQIPLPEEDYGWVGGAAQRIVDELGSAGYHVVGDLDELLPSPPAHCTVKLPSDAELLDVAVRAIAELVVHAPTSPAGGVSRRLTAPLRRLAEQYPAADALRRQVWRGKARLAREWHLRARGSG